VISPRRALGLCGLGTALSLAVAILAAGIPPGPTASAVSVSHFVAVHRTGFAVAAYAGMLTLALGIPYVVGLNRLLRPADEALAVIAMLGGLATFAVASVSSSVQGAIAFRAAALHDIAVNTLAWDITSTLGILVYLPAAVMIGAASLTDVFPRPLRWYGAVTAGLGVVGALAGVIPSPVLTLPAGAALFLLLVWIVLTSLLMLLWREDESA